MNKNKILITISLIITVIFFKNINVYAISSNQAKAIVEYEGANGMENSTALKSGCPMEYSYFTVGGSFFYDNVKPEEIAQVYCDTYYPGVSSCYYAQTEAARRKISDIKADAIKNGFKRQSDGRYAKEIGYSTGCYRSAYVGVRVSIVDEDGGQKSGTKIIDYWAKNPGILVGPIKKSNELRTIIVNGSDKAFSTVPSIGGQIDSAMGNYTTARNTMKAEVIASSASKKIKSNGYLSQLGIKQWSDFDADDHILFEPLFVVTIGTTNYVGTGTEIFSLLMDHPEATWIRSDFITEITSKMVLTEKSSDPKDDKDDKDQTYTLNSNGNKYKVYQECEQDKNTLKSNPALVLKQANGYAMELIWLKPYVEENPCVFDPNNPKFNEECCDDPKYLNDYYADPNTDKNFIEACCYDETYVDFYTATFQEFNPSDDLIEVCCYDPPTSKKYSSFALRFRKRSELNKLCGPTPPPPPHDNDPDEDNCKWILNEPDFDVQVCDTDETNNYSKFMDILYKNKSNVSSDLISKGDGTYTIADNKTIASINNSETISNKFMAFHYKNDGEHGIGYTEGGYDIRDHIIKVPGQRFCEKYCQEYVKITLPDNYPYVQAGRYFFWDINESDHHIIEVHGEKVCAHAIDLTSWIQEYENAAAACQNTVGILATCGTGGDTSLLNGQTDCVTEAWNAYAACVNEVANSPEQAAYNQAVSDNMDSTEAQKAYEDAKKDYCNTHECSVHCMGSCPDGPYQPTEEQKADMEEYANEKKKEKAEEMAEDLKPEEDCSSQYNTYVNISNARSNYKNNCLGIDDKGNSHGTTMESLAQELQGCYAEALPTYVEEEPYGFDLDIKYGYITHDEHFFYSNSEIVKNPGGEDSYNRNISQISCISVAATQDTCNRDNIFVVRNSEDGVGDYCQGKDIPYFSMNAEYNVYAAKYSESGGSYYKTAQYDASSKKWVPVTDTMKRFATIYVTKESIDDYYKLNNNINACVCKDGTVIDLSDDGECNCVLKTEVEKIKDVATENYCYISWESQSYYEIEGGNFSVEYMLQTGYYPLVLDYGNIGYEGHFSNLIAASSSDESIYCPDGTCHYSDETVNVDDPDAVNHVCAFFLNNEILFDKGDIEDSKCPDGDCPPSPPSDVCPDGDCPPYCPDGICPEEPAISGLELIYRVIDLDDPFPGSDGEGRKPGINWQGNEDIISNNREKEGSELYRSDIEPLYTFELTPATIKKIRQFNKYNKDYASLETMIYSKGSVEGGVSHVLRTVLRQMIEPYGTFEIKLADDRFESINKTLDEIGATLDTCETIYDGVMGE